MENGAVEQNKLEPLAAPELLEELESWSQILVSEPEFERALSGLPVQPEMEP